MKDIVIYFDVPGVPVGKARPRHDSRGHVYTPKETVDYQGRVAAAYWQALNKRGAQLTEAMKLADIEISIVASYPIAQSDSKKRREDKLAGKIRPRVKPDADNVAKIVMDALNDFAYHDDGQVIKLSVIKEYSLSPAVSVRVVHKDCIEEESI